MQRLSRAERVVQKLEQIALREGDTDGTQVRALELLGKTLGLFVDRSRQRTRRRVMLRQCGLNWRRG
jgi:predicted RNA-binding Zn ribbon-like protein